MKLALRHGARPSNNLISPEKLKIEHAFYVIALTLCQDINRELGLAPDDMSPPSLRADEVPETREVVTDADLQEAARRREDEERKATQGAHGAASGAWHGGGTGVGRMCRA